MNAPMADPCDLAMSDPGGRIGECGSDTADSAMPKARTKSSKECPHCRAFISPNNYTKHVRKCMTICLAQPGIVETLSGVEGSSTKPAQIASSVVKPKLKKGPTAFICFLYPKCSELKQLTPGLVHKDAVAQASKLWNEMDDTAKAPYVVQAQRLNEELKERHRATELTGGGVPMHEGATFLLATASCALDRGLAKKPKISLDTSLPQPTNCKLTGNVGHVWNLHPADQFDLQAFSSSDDLALQLTPEENAARLKLVATMQSAELQMTGAVLLLAQYRSQLACYQTAGKKGPSQPQFSP